MLGLVDVPIDEGTCLALDQSQRRHRTLDGLKRLVLLESQTQPVITVFEDLHGIDGETQAFLDSLVKSVPSARLLLLVNYRPEYQHAWSGRTYYTQLRPALTESAEGFLEAMLGAEPSLLSLKHLLIDRTEGNPFFMEESVRSVLSRSPSSTSSSRPMVICRSLFRQWEQFRPSQIAVASWTGQLPTHRVEGGLKRGIADNHALHGTSLRRHSSMRSRSRSAITLPR